MKSQYLNKKNKLIYIIIIIFILILDIFSKFWIQNHIKLYEKKEIFLILNFFHVHNYGAAFSVLSDQKEWQRWFLSTISIITTIVVTKIIIQCKQKEVQKISAYSFIIAGAIGNLIDRIFFGFVIDFIDIHFNNWHLAIFNIADLSIFIGILMLIKNNN